MSFDNTPSQNDLSDRKESLQARYRLDRENQFASQFSNPSEFKSDQKSDNKLKPPTHKNSPENTKHVNSNDITSKYLSAQAEINPNEDLTSSVQQRPVISRFGMSPIRTSEIRSNLTFEDKAQSKHRLLTNTLSKNRNVYSNNKYNSELRSEDRYINLDGVVEIQEDGDEQKDHNDKDDANFNGNEKKNDDNSITNDSKINLEDKVIIDKFNKIESKNDNYGNGNLDNNIYHSNQKQILKSSEIKNNEYYTSQKSNQQADQQNLINGDNSSKKDDIFIKNEKIICLDNNSDVKNNIKHNEIEQTFKPNQIINSLDDNKQSNHSLSFDIQNNTLTDTLEIDNFKPSDSRKKFQDCQPLIQDLKNDYAGDNERFDQLLSESIGRQNENDFSKINDNEKSSHRQSDQSNNVSRDREKKHSNLNDDLSDVKLTLNNMNVSSYTQNSADIQKINERIERIEKSVLNKSQEDKDNVQNKLELVQETVKMLQNKLESQKNQEVNKNDNELISNEQSMLNNLPSFGSNNESNEINNANLNNNKDNNDKDFSNYKFLKDDILKLENKNKDLVKLMKDQENIFKKTEDNYKNYINNLLKIQSYNQKYEQITNNTLLKCNDTQNYNKNIQSNNNEVNKTIRDYEIIIKDLKNENQSLKNGGNEIFLRDNSKNIKLEQMQQEAIYEKRKLTTENKKISDELKILKNKQDKEVNVIKKKLKDYEDEIKRFRKI